MVAGHARGPVLPTNLLTGLPLPARRGQSLPGREAGGRGSEWPAPSASRLSEWAQCPLLLQTRPPEPRRQLCDLLPGVGVHPPPGLAALEPPVSVKGQERHGKAPEASS